MNVVPSPAERGREREGAKPRETMTTSLYYDESHEAFRQTARRFVEKEIIPHVDEWDEAGGFPRELYKKAADVGILGLGYPEEYGGSPCDQFHRIVLSQELARAACGGVSASLMSHTIGSPPILAVGPEAMTL